MTEFSWTTKVYNRGEYFDLTVNIRTPSLTPELSEEEIGKTIADGLSNLFGPYLVHDQILPKLSINTENQLEHESFRSEENGDE